MIVNSSFAAAVLATLAMLVAAAPGTSIAATVPLARAACSRDIPATIGGVRKCLGAGEYCARRYERQYERYGFICSTSYSPPRLKRR
jgi:hypothetical protein